MRALWMPSVLETQSRQFWEAIPEIIWKLCSALYEMTITTFLMLCNKTSTHFSHLMPSHSAVTWLCGFFSANEFSISQVAFTLFRKKNVFFHHSILKRTFKKGERNPAINNYIVNLVSYTELYISSTHNLTSPMIVSSPKCCKHYQIGLWPKMLLLLPDIPKSANLIRAI